MRMSKLWAMALLSAWAVVVYPAHAADSPSRKGGASEAALMTFAKAQRNAVGVTTLDGSWIAQEAVACTKAMDANQALLKPINQSAAILQNLAKLASDAQSECDSARRDRKRLEELNKELQAAAFSVLRLVASDIGDCRADKAAPCRAEVLEDVVDTLEVALQSRPDDKALVASKKQLLDAAGKAQKLVTGAKAKTDDAYKLGDLAAATALANEAIDDNVRRGRELRDAAKMGSTGAAAAKQAISNAQEAANVLVNQARELAVCPSADLKCLEEKKAARTAAAWAQTMLRAELAQAEEQYGKTKEAVWGAAAGSHPKLADRRRSVAFARLLDTYPDARSLVGESSAGQITASSGDATATLKYSLGRTALLGAQQHSITFSSPIGADGLSRNPQSLAYSTYWVRGLDQGSATPVLDLLWVAGLSPKIGFKESDYYDAARFGETLSSRQKSWSISAFFGYFRMKGESPDVHLIELALKRDAVPRDTEIRCATPTNAASASVKCLEGVFGPPERAYSRVLRYQWRTEYSNVALSPTLTYDDRSRETRFELPIYLIRPEGKDQPFNAGIRLDWGSKTRDRIGVFVGTNFDSFGLPGH